MFKREVNRQQVSILVTRIPRYTRFNTISYLGNNDIESYSPFFYRQNQTNK